MDYLATAAKKRLQKVQTSPGDEGMDVAGPASAVGTLLGSILGTIIAPGVGTSIGGAIGGAAGNAVGQVAKSSTASKPKYGEVEIEEEDDEGDEEDEDLLVTS